MRAAILVATLLALISCRHLHEAVVGSTVGSVAPSPWGNTSGNWGANTGTWGTSSSINFPAPNMGGSWVRPNNLGGSTVNPWTPNPWNTNPWNSGSTIGRGTTSLSGITCVNGMVNPTSLGRAVYGGPTRMSCNAGGRIMFSDICTNVQQCANLMCAKYTRGCPGRISMSAA